jgi:hypothetical protein
MPAKVRRQHRFRVRPRDKGQAWCAEFAHLAVGAESRIDIRCAGHFDCLGTDLRADGADLGAAAPDPGSPQRARGVLLDAVGLVAS